MKQLLTAFILAMSLLACQKDANTRNADKDNKKVSQLQFTDWERYKHTINNTYTMTYYTSGFYFPRNKEIKVVIKEGKVINSTVSLNEAETMDTLFNKHLINIKDDCHHKVIIHENLPVISEIKVDCEEEGYGLKVIDFTETIEIL